MSIMDILNIIKIIVGSFFLKLYKFSNLLFMYSFKHVSFDNYKKKLFETEHKDIELETIEKSNDEKSGYSCVSFNIHNGFDLFNNYKIKEIITCLHKLDADIICLQEVFDKVQFDYIKKHLKYDYSFFIGELCILSKYNFDNVQTNYFDTLGIYDNNNCIISTININDTKLHIINVHLLNDITFYKQDREIKEIMNYVNWQIDRFKDKIMIIGDFNYCKHFKEIYSNQFSKLKPEKSNRSYPSIYPLLNLDKVYYRNLKLTKVEFKDIYYSDHKPLYTEFTL